MKEYLRVKREGAFDYKLVWGLMSGGTILADEQRSISAINEGISLSSAHCNATV